MPHYRYRAVEILGKLTSEVAVSGEIVSRLTTSGKENDGDFLETQVVTKKEAGLISI